MIHPFIIAAGAALQVGTPQALQQDDGYAPWARESARQLRAVGGLYGPANPSVRGNQTVNRREMQRFMRAILVELRGNPAGRRPVIDRARGLAIALSPAAEWREVPDDMFKDADPGHIWVTSLEDARTLHLIDGFPDEYYRDKRPATRAELATILYRALMRAKPTPLDLSRANFRDVDGSEWCYGAVLVAAGSGLMTGYADHTFRPKATVTRNETVLAVARTLAILQRN